MFWVTNTDSTATAGLFFPGLGSQEGPSQKSSLTHSQKKRPRKTGRPSNERTNAPLVFSLLTQDGKPTITFVLPYQVDEVHEVCEVYEVHEDYDIHLTLGDSGAWEITEFCWPEDPPDVSKLQNPHTPNQQAPGFQSPEIPILLNLQLGKCGSFVRGD